MRKKGIGQILLPDSSKPDPLKPSGRLKLPEQAIIVLSTRNEGKLRELRAMMGTRAAEVIDLTELEKRLGLPPNSLGDAPEPGVTYKDNADIKARSIAKAIRESYPIYMERYVVIADDSGVELDGISWKNGGNILNGECTRLAGKPFPGVDTKQFDDACGTSEKTFALFDKMAGKGRGMTAVTMLAVRLPAMPDDVESHFFSGTIKGTLASETRGTNGFGYDPYFIPEGHSLTFAEMTPAAKNALSHRRRAFESMLAEASVPDAKNMPMPDRRGPHL